MGLVRLLGQADRRAGVAVLGLAAALLMPLAAALVLQGLEPTLQGDDAIVHHPGPPPGKAWTIFRESEGVLFAATSQSGTVGVPLEPGEAVIARGPVPELALDGSPLRVRVGALPGSVPSDAVLVAPETLGDPHWTVEHTSLSAAATPARGADAFEERAVGSLRAMTLVLTLGALPGAAAVAAIFMAQDARERRPTTQLLSALGKPRLALLIGAVRTALLVAGGSVTAVAAGFLLYTLAPAFHPADAKPRELALVVLAPAAAAFAAGSAAYLLQTRRPRSRSVPLPWLRPRPLVLGVSALPALGLAALLFLVQIGVPLGAGSVPVQIAGDPGEFVVTDGSGLFVSGTVPATPAAAIRLAPGVASALAEVLVFTLVDDRPVVVRGADWTEAAEYHGLELSGSADGLVLGGRLAHRAGWDVGDVVWVQASDLPHARPIQVTGAYTGGGILEDEAFLPIQTARALAGLGPSEASVVRVRPQEAGQAAYQAPGEVQVLAVRLDPPDPQAGQAVNVHVDVANVGSGSARRHLPVRVHGEPQGSIDASLAAWQRTTYTVRILVPPGPFEVAVNPEAHGEAAGGGGAEVPTWAVAGEPFRVRNTTGEVRLLAAPGDAEALASAAADGTGTASPTAPQAGRFVVATSTGQAWITLIDPADRDVARLQVVDAWTVPPRPGHLEPFEVHATLRNVGGAEGVLHAEVFVVDARVDVHDVEVPPGEQRNIVSRLPGLSAGTPVRVEQQPVSGTGSAGAGGGDQDGGGGSDEPAPPSVAIARRVFGGAEQVLIGLAGVAIATGLAIVYLSTDRVLRDRARVVGTLQALGLSAAAIRRRASWEAVGLAGGSFVAAFLFAKGGLWVLRRYDQPAPFGHVLPDPFGWLVFVQGFVAFTAAAALAAFLAAGPVVAANPIAGPGRNQDEDLPAAPVEAQLAGGA